MGIHLWVFGLNQSFMPILEIINFESFHRNVEWGEGGHEGKWTFFPIFLLRLLHFLALCFSNHICFFMSDENCGCDDFF